MKYTTPPLMQASQRRPEVNIKVKTAIGRLPSGLVVQRDYMSTGNFVDSILNPLDHADAKPLK